MDWAIGFSHLEISEDKSGQWDLNHAIIAVKRNKADDFYLILYMHSIIGLLFYLLFCFNFFFKKRIFYFKEIQTKTFLFVLFFSFAET